MKLIVFLAFVIFTDARIIRDNETPCFKIDDKLYHKEILRTGIKNPYQMTIDYDTNTLFYSYTAHSDQIFKIEYLSLKTGETGMVKGINNGFASAVNLNGHKIYMGGEDGLYQFNYDTKSAIKLDINKDVNIWQMFYKDGLYFTTYPDETAYVLKEGVIDKVPELVNTRVLLMAVKNDGNYVFGNSSGIFLYDQKQKSTIHLGDNIVNGFTTDVNGNIYFSSPVGIYVIKENVIENIVTLDNIYGVAIEADGSIIYAEEDSIIKLTRSKEYCSDDVAVKSQ